MLGQIYYQGTRSIPQDFNEAMYFFRQVTEKLPNGKVTEAILNSKRGQAIGQAAGYIGKMYWRGEGVEKDEEMAYQWFYLGSELNDSIAQNGLGMMYLNGVVVPKASYRILKIPLFGGLCYLFQNDFFRIVKKQSSISNELPNTRILTHK